MEVNTLLTDAEIEEAADHELTKKQIEDIFLTVAWCEGRMTCSWGRSWRRKVTEMLSDAEIEEAAEVVAAALAKYDVKTRLAQGIVAVAALEDAGYVVERLDPGPPELGDHLEDLLRASLADRSGFAAAQASNILQGNFRRGGAVSEEQRQ